MRRSIPSNFASSPKSRPGTAIGITWRGFWTGIFLSFFLAIGAPYANMAMHSTFMAWDFNTPGAIFLFLVLIGLLNVLFKVVARNGIWALGVAVVALGLYLAYYLPQPQIDLFKPGLWFASFLMASVLLNAALVWHGRSLALDRADLVLVYIMLLMVSALCTMGMSQQLLPILAAFAYYGTPQNQWQEKLGPLLPERAILVDDGEDNRAFFEGGEIPYGAWAEPLLWWGVFLIALYATMVAAAVILRRQWMDRERLAYPVAQVGAAMVQGEGRSLVNRFFKSRAMWYGCAIPVLWGSLEALHQYYPSLPNVNLNWSMPYFGQRLQLRIIFAMVGFSYLINTSISAGLWIFQLLVRAESEVLLLMGLTSKQKFVYGIASQPYLAYQGGGALLALVLAGLWVGREHLKRVFRKAFWGARDIDDGDEIVPYRGAVCALIVGVATMVGWLWLMGVQLWVAAVFIGLALLIFIGISRIVAEAGLAAVRSPMIAPDLMIYGLGVNAIGTGGVFNLSLAYIWCADIRIFVMALLANGLKLVEDMTRPSRRVVMWGSVLGDIDWRGWFVLDGAAHGAPARGDQFGGVVFQGRAVNRVQLCGARAGAGGDSLGRARFLRWWRRGHALADVGAASRALVAVASAGFCGGGQSPDGQDMVQHLHCLGGQADRAALWRAGDLRGECALLLGADYGREPVQRPVDCH